MRIFYIILLASSQLFFACNGIEKPPVKDNLSNTEIIVSQIDSVLTFLADEGQFNGSVLLFKEDSILYNEFFGMADLENQIPLTRESRYNLRSVAKQFVSMGVMILYEDGQLSFDDKLIQYLPDLPYPDVTIRQVLTHTSGIPCIHREMEKYKSEHWKDLDKIGNRDIYKFIIENKPSPSFQTGATYGYSNTNYLLLDILIEEVARQPVADFLNERIFAPLDMNLLSADNSDWVKGHQFSYDTYSYNSSFDAYAYHFLSGKENMPYRIFLSTTDFVKWHEGLINHKLVAKETIDEAWHEEIPDDGTKTKYGFGWQVKMDSIFGIKAFHSGGGGGFMIYFSHFPKQNIAVAVLSNKATNGASGLFTRIENILLKQPFTWPKLSLAEEFRTSLGTENIDDLIAQFRLHYGDSATYIYSERHMLKIGQALTIKDRMGDAWKIFDLVIEVNPQSVYAYNFIGEWNMILENYETSKRYYNKTLELDPANVAALTALKTFREKEKTTSNKK